MGGSLPKVKRMNDKGKWMSDNQTRPSDMADLLAFYGRGNTADILQAREGEGWGAAWTFAPCEVHAAEKAAWMILRMHRGSRPTVRHARRARLHDRQRQTADVVVVTELPEHTQAVTRIDDGVTIRVDAYLVDDALAALEAALAPTPPA